MSIAEHMWHLDQQDPLTSQARALAWRLIEAMDRLPSDIPDEVKVHHYHVFLRAASRMRRRAKRAALLAQRSMQ